MKIVRRALVLLLTGVVVTACGIPRQSHAHLPNARLVVPTTVTTTTVTTVTIGSE